MVVAEAAVVHGVVADEVLGALVPVAVAGPELVEAAVSVAAEPNQLVSPDPEVPQVFQARVRVRWVTPEQRLR